MVILFSRGKAKDFNRLFRKLPHLTLKKIWFIEKKGESFVVKTGFKLTFITPDLFETLTEITC